LSFAQFGLADARLGSREGFLDGYNKASTQLSEYPNKLGKKLSNMPLIKQLRGLSGLLDGYIPTSGKFYQFKTVLLMEKNMNPMDKASQLSKHLGKLSKKFSDTSA
jgi:hypothetical protein